MAELFPDLTLFHYSVVSKIGAGGIGEVYRARLVRTRRTVALKIFPAEIAKDRDQL